MELQSVAALGEALAIGLLIGAERYKGRPAGESSFAGVRTFALISLLGGLCGLLEAWALTVVAFAGLAVLISISYYRSTVEHPGLTTEFAALLTFWLGFLMHSRPTLSVSTGIVMVILLASKGALHHFVKTQITERELFDTLKFLAIIFVAFPLLPNRSLGPYEFFNPTQIWLLIVLVSSISYAGYFLIRVFGANRGLMLNSLLGGLVSTTASTMSLATRAREAPEYSRFLGVTSVMANSMQFPRVLLLTWFVDPALSRTLVAPLTAMFAAGNLGALLMSRAVRKGDAEKRPQLLLKNPYSFVPALKFGIFFVVVYALSKFLTVWYGQSGAYLAAAGGSLVSVTAVALSTAKLVSSGSISSLVGLVAILIGITTNACLKWILARLNGSRELAFWLGGGLLTMLGVGLGVSAMLFVV